MTNSIKASGSLLTANADTRTLTYRLLPFGEPGRTSVGTVTVAAGAVTLPEDATTLVANMEHDRTRPVGRFVSVTETDTGLEASVRVATTGAGNDLLVEASEGLRTGISVEIDSPVIRSGALLAGTLSGAGFVTHPAFPSALLTAADAGELPDYLADTDSSTVSTEEVVIDGVTYVRKTTSTHTSETTRKNDDNAEDSAENEEDDVTNTTVTAAAPEGINGGTKTTKKSLTASEAFATFASTYRTRGLEAALANVTHDDGDNDGDGLGEIGSAPAWLGEIWAAAPYQRKYVPLIGSGPLSSYQERGYRIVNKPVVAPYAGNKAEVPTGGMTAEPVSYGVQRWAHAADIDRRFVDFGDSDVIRAFVEAQVDSYRRVTDVDTLTKIVGSANAVTRGTVPTNVNVTTAAVADAALALVADDFNPTFAIVGAKLYRDLLLTPKDQVAEFLSQAAGFEGGSLDGFRIIPSAHASVTNKIVVGDGSTLRLKELGGGTPIRVEAEHVSHGGRDLAVFGYTSFQELVDGGVRVVTIPTT